jgi:hypothetical protein
MTWRLAGAVQVVKNKQTNTEPYLDPLWLSPKESQEMERFFELLVLEINGVS